MNRAKTDSKLDLVQGTLDLMVLQTLDAMGALHGYGIARRIEQLSGRRAKFYAITKAGKRQMKEDKSQWERCVSLIDAGFPQLGACRRTTGRRSSTHSPRPGANS
jgi:DNA-binding PadR family transcriptional regulator